MEWLNYHHLLYFWVVAKLLLAHPTISGQIHRLEDVLGEKLFVRRGRNLELTDAGRVAFRYADEIFSIGQEFLDVVKGRATGKQLRVVVGLSDVLAKSTVFKILEPAFHLADEVRVVCREGTSESLMGELATHAVDIILSDAPAGPGSTVKAFSHSLGTCGSSFFAAPQLAKALRRGFPRSLEGAPVLLPGADSTFRRALNEWFDSLGIRPKIIAELDDAALVEIFAEEGLGFFAAPDVVEKEIARRYNVQLLGRVRKIRQQFFAISVERKIRHPAVAAICDMARKQIFAA
jgi:LysR family transcriptional activator of nhaA